MGETIDRLVGAGDLDGIAAGNDTDIGVLIAQAEDIGIVDTVESNGVDGFVQSDN